MLSFFNIGSINSISYTQNDGSVTLSFIKVIIYFISFLLVVFLAFYFTKLIAKKTSCMTKSNNIQVLDFVSLSSNIKIAIVNIIDNIYILSINNNEVIVIDKLSKDDVNIANFITNSNQKSFNNYFEDILKNTNKLKTRVFKPKTMDNISVKDSQKDKE